MTVIFLAYTSDRSAVVEHPATVRKVVGSTPSRVIPKIPKMVLDASLLDAQQVREGSRVSGEIQGERVAPSPTFG